MSEAQKTTQAKARKQSRVQRPSHVGLQFGGPHKSNADSSSRNSKDGGPFLVKAHHRRQHVGAAGGEDGVSVMSSMKTTTDVYNRNYGAMENSYKLQPDCKVVPSKIETIIHKVLEDNLAKFDYVTEDSSANSAMSRHMADLIKQQVKKLKMDRFKIIVTVSICDQQCGDVRMTARFLWDDKNDNYATGSYKNQTLYAIGNVYLVYQD